MTDDARSIEEAVRRFLAEEDGDGAAQPVGVAATWRSLWRAARDPRVVRLSQRADVTQLDVLEVDGEQASVALDAVVHTRWRDEPTGSVTGESLLMAGPVSLRRVDGQWRVTDYCVEGRPVSVATFVDPSGSQEGSGVRVAARGALLSGRITAVVLEIENDRETDLRVLWSALRTPGRLPGYSRLALLGRDRVQAGGTALVAMGRRAVTSLRTPSLAVALLLRDAVTRERLPFHFDIHLTDAPSPSAAQPGPYRLPLAARVGAHWHGGTGFLVAAIAVSAYLAAAGRWGLLGLLSLACGAMIAVLAARPVERRALGRRWLVAGVTLVVLGIGLLLLFPESRQLT